MHPMGKKGKRPPFAKAMARWRQLIGDRGLSPNMKWIFREHLCLEPHRKGEEEERRRRISFQTQFPPVTEDDVRDMYASLVESKTPIVFMVMVQTGSYTLCTLLGDEYRADNDVYEEEWDLYFFLKEPYRLFEEIADKGGWKRRKRRESKDLSGLDYIPVLTYLRQHEKPWGPVLAWLRSEAVVEQGVLIPLVVALIYLVGGYLMKRWEGVFVTAAWVSLSLTCLWVGRFIRDRWNRWLLGLVIESVGWAWLLLVGFIVIRMGAPLFE